MIVENFAEKIHGAKVLKDEWWSSSFSVSQNLGELHHKMLPFWGARDGITKDFWALQRVFSLIGDEFEARVYSTIKWVIPCLKAYDCRTALSLKNKNINPLKMCFNISDNRARLWQVLRTELKVVIVCPCRRNYFAAAKIGFAECSGKGWR